MSGHVSLGTRLVAKAEAHRFIKDCMLALGTPQLHADLMAKVLIEADYRGHFSQGLNRLPKYIDEARESLDVAATPEIIKETQAISYVDGRNSLGMVSGTFAMDLAMKKAKDVGIGFVVVKGCNLFGIAGVYSMMACEQGMIGMSFSTSSPLVAPPRAKAAAYGTNAISFFAPGSNNDGFQLDMATSAVAAGRIEMLGRERLPIPETWADLKTGALRPLGGPDPEQNYKGFGLGLMVEILCGVLSDAAYGPNTRKYGETHKNADLGQCFIAIDPSFFAAGFADRVSEFLGYMRNLEPIALEQPVRIPGDRDREHMANVEAEGGIRYLLDILESCENVARDLKVEPIQCL